MKIEDFDWESLYKKTDLLMKELGANEYTIAENEKTLFGDKPYIKVYFPKRINTIAMIRLDAEEYARRIKGYKKDGKYYCVYLIRQDKNKERRYES